MEKRQEASVQVVVLAGGNGTRLRSLATDARGTAAPKQFCRLIGDETMLAVTLHRASWIAPPERIMVVVAEQHRKWWEDELASFPPRNILVQPANRGTAVGILFPLAEIAGRDPEATVVILPSDHFVGDEETLRESFRAALEATRVTGGTVLLGMMPDAPDTSYGWIVPDEGRGMLRSVRTFAEKPVDEVARALLEGGALWNSFMIAGSVRHLLTLYARTCPEILSPFLREPRVPQDGPRLARLYETLPTRDFSRDVLQRVPRELSVLKVPSCGWTDLGTPARLEECLSRARRAGAFEPATARQVETAVLTTSA